MTKAQRLFSLSILGVLNFSFIAVASAEGTSIDPELREQILLELSACREQGTPEEKRVCMEEVREKYEDQVPHLGRRYGRRVARHNIRKNISEECGQREDTDEWRECAQDVREQFRENRPAYAKKRIKTRLHKRFGDLSEEQRETVKDELRACRDEETYQERRDCFKNVIKSYAESIE